MKDSDLFAGLDDADRAKVRKARWPEWVEPMKATLVKEAFSDPAWIFEPKLDGVRCLAFKRGTQVNLLSRNRKSMNASYPEILDAVASRPGVDAVFDGEIVAFKDGAPSFSALQSRMHLIDPDRARRTGVAVFFHVFDIVHAAGYDLRGLRLVARKKVLKTAISFRSPLRFVSHRNRDGLSYFEDMCRKPGWEGVIAKRAESRYSGDRSRDWLKFKCSAEQELVIGGYTDPKGERTDFGALLVGYYENGVLRYAGKVGTGFGQATLRTLASKLGPLRRSTSPFGDPVREKAHWVTPKLVAQIGFSEWTRDGRLRHPRYLGLRNDKDPREVVRERPA